MGINGGLMEEGEGEGFGLGQLIGLADVDHSGVVRDISGKTLRCTQVEIEIYQRKNGSAFVNNRLHYVKYCWREQLHARKSQRGQTIGGAERRRTQRPRGDIGPTRQAAFGIEQKVSLRLAAADHQQAHLLGAVGLAQSRNIDGTQYIHIAHQNRFIACQQRTGMVQSSPRFQQLVSLIAQRNGAAEIVLLRQISLYLVGKMVHIDDNIGDTRCTEALYLPLQQRLTRQRQQRLGVRIGERLEPRAEACGKNHGFHRMEMRTKIGCMSQTNYTAKRLLRGRLQVALDVLLAVNEMHRQVIGVVQVASRSLSAIDRAVLPARAAKTDLQVGESSLQIPLDMVAEQRIELVQERQNLAIPLQEIDDRLIQARERLILLVLAGIVR